MSRNWQADQNPPRHWRPKARISRDVDPGSPIYLTDGTNYVPLRQLPQPVKEVVYEAIDRWDRLNPIRRIRV